MISFVTAIKLMPGYEDYVTRLRLYIECVATLCRTDYEIIVVEEMDRRIVARVRDFLTDEWLLTKKVKLLDYHAEYRNPHGYNMIEAYAKNVGLKAARFPFVCITNCDVLFNEGFFDLCTRLQPKTFYRFLQYETPTPAAWDFKEIQGTFESSVCFNPSIVDPANWNLKTIAFKSGDVMLMDRESWLRIKGFPENDVWVHSDLIVCLVANNVGMPLHVDPEAKVYTYPQERTLVERDFELKKTYEYAGRKTCN